METTSEYKKTNSQRAWCGAQYSGLKEVQELSNLDLYHQKTYSERSEVRGLSECAQTEFDSPVYTLTS